MTSPLSVKRNNYHENKKSSTIYTPTSVAKFLFDLLHDKIGDGSVRSNIFDPAIGTGRLTDPWAGVANIVGCDIHNQGPADCYLFECDFEQFTVERIPFSFTPRLVLCNPPFNGKKKLYPEVFLRHIFELWGIKQPTVLFCPMGMLLNQRKKSKRWRWLRDCGADLSSIISLPLDIFDGVEFHNEILIFNVNGLKSHYFLPEEYL
jgi:hypothetical protein